MRSSAILADVSKCLFNEIFYFYTIIGMPTKDYQVVSFPLKGRLTLLDYKLLISFLVAGITNIYKITLRTSREA